MAALRGPPPPGIWLRGGNGATAAVEAVRRRHQAEIVAAAASGDVAYVEGW